MDKFWDLFKGKERLALEFQQKLAEQIFLLNQKQIEVNIQEAKHKSVFVAGWRPFIGWVCGFSFLYHYILRDFLQIVFGTDIPPIELNQMIGLVLTLLGVGGYNYFKKIKNKN